MKVLLIDGIPWYWAQKVKSVFSNGVAAGEGNDLLLTTTATFEVPSVHDRNPSSAIALPVSGLGSVLENTDSRYKMHCSWAIDFLTW